MTWMTMLMATLALRCHHQQLTRTYCALVRNHNDASKMPTSVRFDNKSFRIGIDPFASAYMFPNREHFTSYKEESGHECKGIASRLNIAGQGTLNLKIDDDNGRTHDIYVLDAVHTPDLPLFLLPPPALGTYFDQQNDGNNRRNVNGALFSRLCKDNLPEHPDQHPTL